MFYDFYATGSDDQITLFDNQQSFRQIKLRPKILIGVSSHSLWNSINCQTKILNSSTNISFLCMIAPTSFHRLANNEYGELATVRAAVACSTNMCVSAAALTSMEILADKHRKQIKENHPHSQSQLLYQLYVFKNQQFSKNLIQRVERSGYQALVITVDTCKLGNSECGIHK